METLQPDSFADAEQLAQRELERHAFVQRFAPSDPTNEAVLELHEVLAGVGVLRTLDDRAEWLESLGRWVLEGPALPTEDGITVREDERTLRLRLLIAVLGAEPMHRDGFAATVRAVVSESSGMQLFCATGLPLERGFFYEAVDRFLRHVLPSPRDARDLAALLLRIVDRSNHAQWLAHVDPMLLCALVQLLAEGQVRGDFRAFTPMRDSMIDAVSLMSQRISTLGLSDDVRARSPQVAFKSHPFIQVGATFTAAVADFRGGGRVAAETRTACQSALKSCRRFVRVVFRHLDSQGMSVDLVYRLELILKGLERLELMFRLLDRDPVPTPTPPNALPVGFADSVGFLTMVIQDAHREKSLLSLVRTNSRHLARKVIERNGHGGEVYITSNRAEWLVMLGSAAGGGFLTAFTAAFKYVVLWLSAPRFFEGLFLSVDYAGSFLLMQVFGFTLATKQPSMTAAALAAVLAETAQNAQSRARQLNSLVDLIVRIVRSQLAAAIGNILIVIPSAFLLNFTFRRITGHAFLDATTAEHVLRSLDPIHGGTLPLAALTGVFLWISSVAGGWLENWSVYRRLPQAIAEHRGLRTLFGTERMTRFADKFGHNISSAGGSVALGTLLGMAPSVGAFIGVPLEGRHVTLSTGSLTFATCALGWHGAMKGGLGLAGIGVLCILVLNFGVSFTLALIVALRAREVPAGDQLRLGRATFSRLLHSPLEFLVPPRRSAPILPALSADTDTDADLS